MGCFAAQRAINSTINAALEIFSMKNTIFVFIILSILLPGILTAQNTEVAVNQKIAVQTAIATVEPSKGYLIGPGDEIVVKVLGEDQFNFTATVNEDGKIVVPFFENPIVAKCKTENELRIDLTKLLSEYLKTPQLSFQTTKKSRSKATIFGEVNLPQPIEIERRFTLVEAIAVAGGLREEAGGMIEVFRTQRPLCSSEDDENYWKPESGDPTEIPSRVYSLANIRMGKEDSNPVILPGDVIQVQKAYPAYITGEVIAPQGILLKEGGTSLSEALAKISGTKGSAKTKEIKIYRLKPGFSLASKERDVLTANLELIKTGQEKDIMLQPYDIIEVDKTKKSMAMTILEFAVGAGKAAVTAAANSTGYRVIY